MLYKLPENTTGASLSKPHISSTAVCKLYIYYTLWYVGYAKLYTQHGSMNINAKYSIAHSHVWATDHIRRSNLANCKFTLVYRTTLYKSKGSKVSEERARQSSSAQH